MQLPTEDKHNYRRRYVESQIAILMGGRVAEELTQDDITTGAGNDIERATEMARKMVCEWGMSQLGPLAYGGGDEPVFLGRDYAQRSDYSEDTAIRIDREVERIVTAGYEKARQILTEHGDLLHSLATDLLDQESIDGKRVYELIEEKTGEDLTPAQPEDVDSGLEIGHEAAERALDPATAGEGTEPAISAADDEPHDDDSSSDGDEAEQQVVARS
jgi:cell division protease FtsH